MNNTKLNPLYNALDGIDEDIAARVLIKKRKLSKKTLLIAVAVAAVLSLLTGFTVANKNFGLRFGANGSYERGFNLNVTSQNFTVPEEFRERGNHFFGYVDIFPSELFPKFGITMLTNENFTDTEETGYKPNEEGRTWEPHLNINIVSDDFIQVTFQYFLHDINIDKAIRFRAEYISDVERVHATYHYGFDDDNETELITLNDGSLCLVSNYGAVFSYNGVKYDISSADYGGEASAELYKQVLADLGIYTPDIDIN